MRSWRLARRTEYVAVLGGMICSFSSASWPVLLPSLVLLTASPTRVWNTRFLLILRILLSPLVLLLRDSSTLWPAFSSVWSRILSLRILGLFALIKGFLVLFNLFFDFVHSSACNCNKYVRISFLTFYFGLQTVVLFLNTILIIVKTKIFFFFFENVIILQKWIQRSKQKSFHCMGCKEVQVYRKRTKPYDEMFKLVLLGDSGVGKSSILVRFTVYRSQLNEEWCCVGGMLFWELY